MTFSSQAGLASFTATPVGGDPSFGQKISIRLPGWAVPGGSRVITLGSAAFELRLSNDGHWYVIHAQGSANAQSLVGQGFEPGRNPWEWSQGYAARIQQELNKG